MKLTARWTAMVLWGGGLAVQSRFCPNLAGKVERLFVCCQQHLAGLQVTSNTATRQVQCPTCIVLRQYNSVEVGQGPYCTLYQHRMFLFQDGQQMPLLLANI